MKKSKTKAIIIVIVVAVVLTATAVVLIVQFTAPKRAIRGNLQIGQQYLEELSYEQAIAAFDAAFSIDPTNEEVKRQMTDAYLAWAEAEDDAGRSEHAIQILTEAIEKLGEDSLILKKQAQIEEHIAEEKLKPYNEFMAKVYQAMEAEDYGAMQEYARSDEALALRDFVRAGKTEAAGDMSFLYFPNENDTQRGIGAGFYSFGSDDYYFYYGNFENGSREGKGRTFEDAESMYTLTEGTFQKNAPNGSYHYTEVYPQGNAGPHHVELETVMDDGIFDGIVSLHAYYDSHPEDLFSYSFTCENGRAIEDVTEEFESKSGKHYEGSIVNAYDIHFYQDGSFNSFCLLSSPGEVFGFYEYVN